MKAIPRISCIKFALCFSILLFEWMNVNAQSEHDYSFINLKKNVLIYDSSSSLVQFFQKLDTAVSNKSGNINIVHIGASHVQAGTLPNRIRVNLMNAFPENIGARGMIFPYSAAKKCNNPLDYSTTKQGEFNLIRNVYDSLPKPLGATGIAVYSSDSDAQIKITLLDSIKYKTNKIQLFGFAENAQVNPTIVVNGKEHKHSAHDSLKRCYTYFTDDFYDSLIINLPNHNSSTFTITGILLENDEPGITYHSIGVNGAKAASFLKCKYFSLDLESINPDLVIFGLGINDAAETAFSEDVFTANYLDLIERIKEVNPDCAFIFITNNDSFKRIDNGKYEVNKRGKVVRDLFFDIAKQTNSAVYDQFEIMGGMSSMAKWEKAKLAKFDKVHFTNKGYQLIGDLFFDAFMKAYINTKKQAEKQQ